MKSFKIEEVVNIYNFNELCKSAREIAIEEHRMFLLERMDKDDFISGDEEFDTEEKLQEAYNCEYDYYLENDEPIIESIEINEYYFYEDGSMANVVEYCGNHEKAGISEFTHKGKVYTF